MSIETFTITPKGEQTLSGALAFAKGLLPRLIINGASAADGVVTVYMLPKSAGRYIGGKQTYDDDRQAVVDAIKTAGYAPEEPPKAKPASQAPPPAAKPTTAVAPAPTKPAPNPTPAQPVVKDA